MLRGLHHGGDLDVGGEADAEGDRVVGAPAGSLLGSQRVVPGGIEGAAQRLRVVAHVVHRPDARGVGLGEPRHVVAAAYLGGVHADLCSEAIDHPLDGDRRLGPAGATVGGRRHGVGDDGDTGEADVVDLVHAGRHPLGERRK